MKEEIRVTELDIDCSYDVASDDLVEEDLSENEVDEMSDSEDLKAAMEEADNAFTPEEIDEMIVDLKQNGMIHWMKEYVVNRAIPVEKLLLGFGVILSRRVKEGTNEMDLLPLLKVTLTRVLRKRERLDQYNTVDDVVNLLRQSKNIMVLTGAGISVSCGIPDFRSSTGLYEMLGREGKYDLDAPEQMFDIHYFKRNPQVFYSFASQIYPSNFVPSPCHRFIKVLEDRGQNIDTLESMLGIQKVLQCHGSFATASCLECRNRVDGSEIKDAIFAKRIAYCELCMAKLGLNASSTLPKRTRKKRRKGKKVVKSHKPWENDGDEEEEQLPVPPIATCLMKPDITFFGEPLTATFDKLLLEDREKVDLLLVIGTSLKVAPVSEILSHLPHSIPQILINKTPVSHVNPDVVLLGDADHIVKYLCQRLEWELPDVDSGANPPKPSRRRSSKAPPKDHNEQPKRVDDSHVWLFSGAEPDGDSITPGSPSLASDQVPKRKSPDSASLVSSSHSTSTRELGVDGEVRRSSKRARKG